MITINIPFKCNENVLLKNDQRVYSSIVRYAFNRFKDKKLSFTKIYQNCSKKFDLPTHLITSAIREAKSIFSLNKEKKVVFGKFKQFLKKKISKEDYKKSRNRGFTSEGAANKKGNQYFKIDLNQNKIIYKRSRFKHIDLILPKLTSKTYEILTILQMTMEEKIAPITFKIKNDLILISFEESLLKIEKFFKLKSNRVLGLDLNPNYIGFSVLEFNINNSFKILHKQVFDLCKLNISSKKSSENKFSKYLTNKRKFELIEICHEISRLMNYWKCSKLYLEDLNIKSSDKKQGRHFNRLCNNVWNRNLVVNKLKMLGNVYGFEVVEVNPAYSSFVGNMLYGDEHTPDMIASSIEIARRGYKKFEKKWFYPVFNVESIDERWKQTLAGIENWKEAFKKVKESKMMYRFQLSDYIRKCCL